jgi:hypothetical protein
MAPVDQALLPWDKAKLKKAQSENSLVSLQLLTLSK